MCPLKAIAASEQWEVKSCCEAMLYWLPSLPVGPGMWLSVTEISGSIPTSDWNAGGRHHRWPCLRQVSVSRSGLSLLCSVFISLQLIFSQRNVIELQYAIYTVGAALFPRELDTEMNYSEFSECHFVATEISEQHLCIGYWIQKYQNREFILLENTNIWNGV